MFMIYVIFDDVIQSQGYLATETSNMSAINAKVKGAGMINDGTPNKRLYDAPDIVFPSTADVNSVFITTSIISTPNQRQGSCIPPPRFAVPCNATTPCPAGEFVASETGYQFTGNCVNNVCQAFGWCPMENDTQHVIISNIGNFTIFLDIQLYFSGFDAMLNNVQDITNNGYPVDGYNLFTVAEIVGNATNASYSQDIARNGAWIWMIAEMDCNLDSSTPCMPKFKYYRIDSQPDTIAYGENFRSVNYYNSSQNRDLFKRYGVRIMFSAYGTAQKTSMELIMYHVTGVILMVIIAFILSWYILEYCKTDNKASMNLIEGDVNMTV